MRHFFYLNLMLVTVGLFANSIPIFAQNTTPTNKNFDNSLTINTNPPPAGDIKAIVAVFPVAASDVKAFALGSLEDPTLIPLVEALFNFDYDLTVWKIIYTSRDIVGNLVDVSGLIIIPQGLPGPAPIGSYAHGTIFADSEAPAYLDPNNDQLAIGLAFATGGYLMFLSDYQAHGDGGGPFSLYVAQLEANDMLNGLQATQLLCNSIGVPLNGKVSLYGYSQGGHVALAAQRALEQHPIPGLNLLVNIAGSGPYDLSGVQLKFLLDNPQYTNPAIIAGISEGFQNVYGNIYQNANTIYAYAEIPSLYNRQLTRDEINQQLADLGVNAWTDMYKPSFIRDLKFNPFNPLRKDLRLNDVYDWKPKKDVKLCYCSEDELVSPLNTFKTLLSFYLKGAFNARAIPLGPHDHLTCAQYATLYAKLIFDVYNGRFNTLLASARTEAESRQVLAKQVNIREYDWQGLQNYIGQSINFPVETVDVPYTNNSDILVYPNPVHRQAHLQLPFTREGTQLVLFDAAGRLIKSVTANDSNFTLDVSDIQDGLYLIKVKGERGPGTRIMVHK